jgi:ABC-type amino acid transport substrate-binding protein
MFSNYMNKLHIACRLFLLMLPLACQGQGSLRVGVADSDGAPIAVISHGMLQPSLSEQIGSAIAQALDRRPDFKIISRKRVEWALENGAVDIVCNANPAWYDDAGQLNWSNEIYPQIERVAERADKPPLHTRAELAGKRISTIRGYHYPSLDTMWASGQAWRDSEESLALMMKALITQVADAAIVSELEYTVWAKANPSVAKQIRLSAFTFTSTPTMCALSPKAHIGADRINLAIDRLRQQGVFKAILRDYQWRAQ